MDTETLVKTKTGKMFAKVLAAGMESRYLNIYKVQLVLNNLKHSVSYLV